VPFGAPSSPRNIKYRPFAMTSDIGEAVLEALADELSLADSSVSELGTYFLPAPAAEEQDVASAICRTEDALGMATWVLTPVYRAAKARIGSSRRDMRAAIAMLAVCPDNATAWAVRKRVLNDILRGHSSTADLAVECRELVDNELRFNALILSRSPKSVEAWSHRAWVLRLVGWHRERVAIEFVIGWKAASAARANYYAGVHRIRALQWADADMIALQIARSREWLQRNISDSSGWWFHVRSVQKLVQLKGIQLDFDSNEADFAKDMLRIYGDECECVRKYYAWFSALSRGFREAAVSIDKLT
jgi:protein prenyltransferase alpha subunit repeat containing protein 1